MKNVFLIHGSMGKPFENWFPWLEQELAKKDIICHIPTFPTPENQTYECWAKLLDYYVQVGLLNENTIVLGHSCGAVCMVKYLAERKLHVPAIISVSGYNGFISGNDFMDNLNSSFYFNDSAYAAVRNLAKTRISYIGEDDPFIPQSYLSEFATGLDSTIIRVKNGGHFNLMAGYNSFDSILEEILQIIE